MATTFTNNNNGTHTLQITYTADSTKMTNILDAAAHWFFDHGFAQFGGPGDYASQTLANKRNIMDAAVKQALIDAATAYHVANNIAIERAESEIEAATNFAI